MGEYSIYYITTDDNQRNIEVEALFKTIKHFNISTLDFYTMNIEQLSFIAKYRILPVPTILVMSNTKVLGRVVHLPPKDKLAKMMQDLPQILQ
jgi:hypothetical protein